MTSGTMPNVKASDVIMIGRRRRRDASMAASRRLLPSECSLRANSTISTAFLADNPTSQLGANLEKGVVFEAAHMNSEHCAHDTKPQDKHDGKRNSPALVKRCQHQKHYYERRGDQDGSDT